MKISIKQRVLALGGVGALGVAAVGVSSLWILSAIGADADATIVATELAEASADIDMMHDALRGDAYQALLTGETSPEAAAHGDWMRSALGDAVRLAADPSVPQEIRELLEAAKADVDQFTGSAERLAAGSADTGGRDDFEAAYTALETELGALGDAIHAHEGAVTDRTRDAVAAGRTLAVVVTLASLAAVAMIAEATRRRLVNGVEEIRQAMTDLSRGDLAVRVRTQGRDELCEIGDAANRIAEVFTESVQATSASVEEILAVADELQSSTRALGDTTKATVSVGRELAESTSTISSMGQEIAAAADELSASVREISRSTDDAARVAGDAVAAAGRARVTMDHLAAAGATIGDVVELISSIASQTHLLALNASIEAARAGDAGQGFSVVADEVKDLAAQTARATEDIRVKVDAIGSGTRATRENLETVSSVISQIAEIQTSVASAVSQQASTTAEISRGITEVSRAAAGIAQNARAASDSSTKVAGEQERVGSAADRLSVAAAGVESCVRKFQL